MKLFDNPLVRKMSSDFVLGFLATALVTAVMQILLYPLINRMIGNVAYGDFLTVIGLVNTVQAVIGSTLNNIRLIHENDYEKKKISGDFNLILMVLSGVSLIASFILFPIFFDMSYLQAFFVGVLIALMAMRNYWAVAYRIIINYRHIFLADACLVMGYLVGCVVFLFSHNWLFPLILGEIFCLIYIYVTTDIIKEPYKFTELRGMVFKDFGMLSITTLSANVLVYLDRLLLYPIIGGEAVTIYTVASLGGKYFGMVATPMAGVLLSYYSQKDFNMTRKKFWYISIAIMVASFMSLIVITPLAPIIARILYPGSYEEALEFMFLANIAGILAVISNFIQPALLKFAATKWQIVKEVIYGGIYIGFGIPLLNAYGLTGFCVANIVANAVRTIFMLVVGHISCRGKTRTD